MFKQYLLPFICFGAFHCVFCWLSGMTLTTAAMSFLIAVVPVYVIGNALHELSHAVALAATGVEIKKIQLVPNVFADETVAFVRTGGIANRVQAFIGLLAPYSVDILLMIVFLLLARRMSQMPKLPLCCILFFIVARSVVSLAMNGCQIRHSNGDFFALSKSFTRKFAFCALTVFLLIEMTLCALIMLKLRDCLA